MNQSVHQLLQVILQGISWVLRTIEMLWVWSWSQITHAFNMSWWNLPPWKLVVGLVFIAQAVSGGLREDCGCVLDDDAYDFRSAHFRGHRRSFFPQLSMVGHHRAG
jgi:hypothetical protein